MAIHRTYVTFIKGFLSLYLTSLCIASALAEGVRPGFYLPPESVSIHLSLPPLYGERGIFNLYPNTTPNGKIITSESEFVSFLENTLQELSFFSHDREPCAYSPDRPPGSAPEYYHDNAWGGSLILDDRSRELISDVMIGEGKNLGHYGIYVWGGIPFTKPVRCRKQISPGNYVYAEFPAHIEVRVTWCQPNMQTWIDWANSRIVEDYYDESFFCRSTPIPLEADSECPNSTRRSTLMGNPIDCATGRKVQTEVDYRGFGPDPLIHSRHYISPRANDSDLPEHTYSQQNNPSFAYEVLPNGYERATFSYGPNLQRVFLRRPFTPSPWPWGWESNPDLKDISIQNTGQGSFTVTLQSGRQFRIDSNHNVVAEFSNQRESDAQFTYDYQDFDGISRLFRKTNRYGRFLQYDYNADGKLLSLTDQDGHRIDYAYDTQGNLARVFYPPSIPGGERPQREYLYELDEFPRHLTGIIDERGNRYATFTYDQDGRAIATEHHDGVERVTVSYPEENTAIVRFYRDTQADQYREEHFTYGRFRGTYRPTRREVTHCEGCQIGTEHWLFNAQGLLQEHIDFNGHRQTWAYDEQGRKSRHTEAVGTPQERSTFFTWSGQRLRTEQRGSQLRTFVYDPQGRVVSDTLTTLP